MDDEKIQVRVTSSGQLLDVVVLSKRLDVIQIVLGEGVHNVRCDLTPTRNGQGYAGKVMGREDRLRAHPRGRESGLGARRGLSGLQALGASGSLNQPCSLTWPLISIILEMSFI